MARPSQFNPGEMVRRTEEAQLLGLDPMTVEDAVRAAEAGAGVHNLHAEPRGAVWEILGDVVSDEQRETIFAAIRDRLGESNVVNLLHVIEPKRHEWV